MSPKFWGKVGPTRIFQLGWSYPEIGPTMGPTSGRTRDFLARCANLHLYIEPRSSTTGLISAICGQACGTHCRAYIQNLDQVRPTSFTQFTTSLVGPIVGPISKWDQSGQEDLDGPYLWTEVGPLISGPQPTTLKFALFILFKGFFFTLCGFQWQVPFGFMSNHRY